jgi:hypothetical protein
VVTLYFRASNMVRQGLWEKIAHPAQQAATSIGALLDRQNIRREK